MFDEVVIQSKRRKVMRVAFVGKGGSGKTTLSTLFVRHVAKTGATTVAIDADINQHMAAGLGYAGEVPSLADAMHEMKEYLRGANPRIASADLMQKTTPAGSGSRLLRVAGDDPIHSRGVWADGALLLATGAFDQEDLGVACYHSKTGAVELYLNHLYDGPGEYVVVDMTAGADSFASGLFTRFDLLVLVVEPTLKSLGVYRQYKEYTKGYGVKLSVLGNKVQQPSDVNFLRQRVGDDLIGWVGQSAAVRALEQGRVDMALEPDNEMVLDSLQRHLDVQPKDWATFQQLAEQFHVRNCEAWANARAGQDLTRQIDPGFRLDVAMARA